MNWMNSARWDSTIEWIIRGETQLLNEPYEVRLNYWMNRTRWDFTIEWTGETLLLNEWYEVRLNY